MRLFNKYNFQEVESESGIEARGYKMTEQFDLKDPVDEDQLEAFWNKVEEDIQADPEWFKVS